MRLAAGGLRQWTVSLGDANSDAVFIFCFCTYVHVFLPKDNGAKMPNNYVTEIEVQLVYKYVYVHILQINKHAYEYIF